jgi:hypothetical protein
MEIRNSREYETVFLEPGVIIEGAFWPERVQIISVKRVGSNIWLEGKGLTSNKLYSTILKENELVKVKKVLITKRNFSGDADAFFLFLEGKRIRFAFQFDPLYAVNVSQIDPLPHQIDAVYHYILRRPRIRFLLADDPGAGKTIMAGLVLKELKLRGLRARAFLLADSKEYDALKFNVRRLLALKSIKEDKEKMKTLTEEDKHRLDEKFRDLDSGLWFRIISTYRYLVKGSEDGIKTFDMGIPTIEGRQTLTGRVKEFLRDQDELLPKLAPKVLLEKVIAKDEEKKSFADLLEAFASFPSLPMLENENVLKNTIRQGVQNGEFGLIVGEKIRYMEPILEDITDDAQIVRKEIAIEKKEKIGKFPEVVAKPITEEKLIPEMIRGIKLVVKVPWDKLHDFVRGVLSPLRMEEADIKKLEIKIEATSTKGIKKETIDMKVKETLKQINADIIEEELK